MDAQSRTTFSRLNPLRRPVFPLAAILLLQALITLPLLWKGGLWLDEAYSALLARWGWRETVAILRYDAGPPLYYWLLSAWRGIFGESAVALRLPSLLCAMATTAWLYFLTKRHCGETVAWTSALFWAVNPLTLHYATEARNYTLLALLAVAWIDCLSRFLQTGSRTVWLAVAALSVFIVYTHNLGWFFVLAGLSATPLLCREIRRLSGIALILPIAFTAYAPWLPVLFAQMQNTHMTIEWARHFQTNWAPLLTLNAFLPGGWTPLYMEHPALPSAAQGLHAAIWLGVLAYAMFRFNRETLWVGGILTLGLMTPYALSLLGPPIYLIGRTDFLLLPLFCLILGAAAVKACCLKSRWIPLSAYFLSSAIIIFLMYTAPTGVNEDEIARYLQRQSQPGDVILCTGLIRPPIEYRLGSELYRFISYPEDMDKQLAHLNEAWYFDNLDLSEEAHNAILRALQALSPDGTLWVVASERPINRPLLDALRDENLAGTYQPIHTPRMGLRKLGEPIYLLRFRK